MKLIDRFHSILGAKSPQEDMTFEANHSERDGAQHGDMRDNSLSLEDPVAEAETLEETPAPENQQGPQADQSATNIADDAKGSKTSGKELFVRKPSHARRARWKKIVQAIRNDISGPAQFLRDKKITEHAIAKLLYRGGTPNTEFEEILTPLLEEAGITVDFVVSDVLSTPTPTKRKSSSTRRSSIFDSDPSTGSRMRWERIVKTLRERPQPRKELYQLGVKPHIADGILYCGRIPNRQLEEELLPVLAALGLSNLVKPTSSPGRPAGCADPQFDRALAKLQNLVANGAPNGEISALRAENRTLAEERDFHRARADEAEVRLADIRKVLPQ